MKSFTLISGILITLLGVFFFANPTNLLAIVGWLFALVMLISGVSSLMVYFKRDNENRSFFQLLQSIISIVFGIILLSTSAWVLSGVAVTIIAWWLLVSAFTQGFQAHRQRQFGFSGLPAVSFACPCGPKDIIRDGEDGLLVENGKTEELAEKINYLIENEQIRKEMGKKARINVQRFAEDVIMQQWIQLFNNLLNGTKQ